VSTVIYWQKYGILNNRVRKELGERGEFQILDLFITNHCTILINLGQKIPLNLIAWIITI
jgi:hypothetical protein